MAEMQGCAALTCLSSDHKHKVVELQQKWQAGYARLSHHLEHFAPIHMQYDVHNCTIIIQWHVSLLS